MALFATDAGNLALFCGMLFLSLVFLYRIQRRAARKRQPAPAVTRASRRKPDERPKPHQAPAEVAKWEVQMHETARDLCATR